jgi:hypothetical protein
MPLQKGTSLNLPPDENIQHQQQQQQHALKRKQPISFD